MFYNTHHAHISHNVSDQRWRACNWIWFHSLDDVQSTKWALSSASIMGHSSQSTWNSHSDTMLDYNIRNEAKHHSAQFNAIKSTAMWSVLLVNLALYSGKSLLTSWSTWLWRTTSVHIVSMYQVLWLTTSIYFVCVFAFQVCVTECIPVNMAAYQYLCVRCLEAFNPSAPKGVLHQLLPSI